MIVTVNNYTRNQDFSGASLIVNHLGELDQPLTCLSGELEDVNYIDIPFLKK